MPRDDKDGATSVNKIFLGEVSSVQNYGAFVSIPGSSNQGLVHKSQISNAPVPDATEVVSRGDRVWCKIIGINEEGKISLSMKVVNQGSGKDLDPNGVIIQQDENRRKTWNPQNRRQAIVLDAVFNTKCSRCGTSGHLSKDCFQVPGGKTYELLPEVNTSQPRSETSAEQIIETVDSKTQAKIKKKLKKERKKMKKQKKKARKLKKIKKRKSKSKSKKNKKHKVSSESSSSSSSSSESSSSDSDEDSDSDHKKRRKRDKRSEEKSPIRRNRTESESKRNSSPLRSRAENDDRGSRNQDKQTERHDSSKDKSGQKTSSPSRNKNDRWEPSVQEKQKSRLQERTGWSSSPESPKRRHRSPSPEVKRRRV